jgi:hypothetical protein
MVTGGNVPQPLRTSTQSSQKEKAPPEGHQPGPSSSLRVRLPRKLLGHEGQIDAIAEVLWWASRLLLRP